MVMLTVKINVPPEKRKELMQTICLIRNSIRGEDGCLGHHWYRDVEDQNVFVLIEEWASGEDFIRHFLSDRFGVLIGALRTLGNQESIRFAVMPVGLSISLDGMERR